MTKWLLVWIAGGTVSGMSLPDNLVFPAKEACEAAAATIQDLSGRKAMQGTTFTVVAACIEIPDHGIAGY